MEDEYNNDDDAILCKGLSTLPALTGISGRLFALLVLLKGIAMLGYLVNATITVQRDSHSI